MNTITTKVNRRVWSLVLLLVLSGLVLLVGLDAFGAGRGQEWLWGKFPAWFVLEIGMIASVCGWDEATEAGTDSLRSRFIKTLVVWAYLAICTGLGLLVRQCLTSLQQAVFVDIYWALVAATVVSFLWLAATTGRDAVRGAGWMSTSLLLLAGLASGVMMWLWGAGLAANSPVIALVVVVLSAPVVLWYDGRLSLRPLRLSYAR
jgi:hypothetical protein